MNKIIFSKQSSGYPYIYGNGKGIFRELTGFKSSAGSVIFRESEKSALFVDGRYTAAAKRSIDSQKFDILDLSNKVILDWIFENIPNGEKIFLDAAAFSLSEMNFWEEKLRGYSVDFHDFSDFRKNNDTPRQKLQLYKIPSLKNELQAKLIPLFKTISDNKLDAYLLCDPCSISWCLNIRDLNTPHSKVVLARMLITAQNQIILYFDDDYVFDSEIIYKLQKNLPAELKKYARVGTDFSEAPCCIKSENLIDIKNPLIFPKSIKNNSEIQNMREAAKKDSVAIINFLYWFHNCGKKISELEAAEKILQFRRQQSGFIGESFECIAAADENSAIVHYEPDEKNNAIVKNILLLDSGGQYFHGTTDITRTVALQTPSPEQRLFYTLVLKGHIALAQAKFSKNTTAAQLDCLARQFLQVKNANYAHGTGHGVGYFSNVHEGPVSISPHCEKTLSPGMILTNEPGYYQENAFGIRLENMMLVKNALGNQLQFEILSLVPFDLKFIEKSLLTESEISWLNEYHEKIFSEISSLLEPNIAAWLKYVIHWH